MSVRVIGGPHDGLVGKKVSDIMKQIDPDMEKNWDGKSWYHSPRLEVLNNDYFSYNTASGMSSRDRKVWASHVLIHKSLVSI